ncbi:MAG TPA: AAA family ATPase [Candidatus Ozemobacteraceae bacterium]|nr:AAA family ATPase [Candidatus Ozemobacteraceae bacterium]
MATSSRTTAVNAIKKALVAGFPVIALVTSEEDQAENAIHSISRMAFAQEGSFQTWDLQQGLRVITPEGARPTIDGTIGLLPALDYLLSQPSERGAILFKDLAFFLPQPEVQRRLKAFATQYRGQNRFLFLVGTQILLPVELRQDIHLIEFSLPDVNELQEIVQRAAQNCARRGAENQLSPDEVSQAAVALQGFTASEAQFTLNKVLWGRKTINAEILPQLHSEKEQLVRKEGILEYYRSQTSLEDVGGLQNLKEWLVKRKKLFSPEAEAAGLHPPRGLLMMGISGCGKSLSVKAISSLWNLPLFRLDMNQVYSGMHGSPEGTFHRAIQIIEAVAPAILWIDEIEGGISSSTAKDGSTGSHIFSAFLTWMQEKSNQVFVAATANRIDLLPAEIIRKGRFDQVFFIDLPNDHEREDILRVHLRQRGNDPAKFDLPFLSVATEGWNGAEIEHVVEAAMIEAFSRGEPMIQDDLYTIIRSTVPLARTMSEQIKFIKGWASERAISASHSGKSIA